MAIKVPVGYDTDGAQLDRDMTSDVSKAGGKAGAAGGKATSKSFSSSFRSGIKGVLAGLGLAAGLSEAKQFLGDSLAEAREAQKVGALTENVIKQTGGAAKVTAKQVEALSGAISGKVGIDDEAIQSGANLLLTFKNVRNEVGEGANVFDRATQAAVDLSASGFGDLNGASKQLGKALNDPIKGISALGRAGVTFSEQQKATIKALVSGGDANAAVALNLIGSTTAYNALLKQNKGDVQATAAALTNDLNPAQKKLFERYSEGNDILGAQKIILKEVESQVGGSAEAQVTASDKARVAIGNLKEEIGTALLPVVDDLANKVANDVVPAISDFIKEFQDGTGTAGEIRDVLEDVGGALKDVANFGKDVLGFFGGLPGPIKKTAFELGVAYLAIRKIQGGFIGLQTVGQTTVAGLKTSFTKEVPAALQTFDRYTANSTIQQGKLNTEVTKTKLNLRGLSGGLTQVAGVGGMLLLADSTTKASRELATFEGAIGGALTGFAVSGGNPIGAAVGLIAGGLIPALKGSGDAAKVAQPEFQSYADTLNQTTGAVTGLTKELLLQDLQKNKVLDTTRALGLSDKQVLAGVSKEGQAREKLVTALKGQVQAANATFRAQALAAEAEGLTGTALVARLGVLDKTRRATTDDAGAILQQIGALDKQTVRLLENKNTLSANKKEAGAAREALRAYARTNGTAKINLAGAGFVKDALRSIQQAANNLNGAEVKLKITASTNANLAELKVLGGKPRAMGGPVTAGVPYIVGERRPEVFVPNQSGRIEPDVGRYMSSVPQAQAAPSSFTYAPVFNGPTTGRERMQEMEWTARYSTSARGANQFPLALMGGS